MQVISQNSLKSFATTYVTFLTESISNLVVNSKLKANKLYTQLVKVYEYLKIVLTIEQDDQILKNILLLITGIFS